VIACGATGVSLSGETLRRRDEQRACARKRAAEATQ
jgi:hypothetical protein